MNLTRAATVIAVLEARAVAAPSAETLYAQGQDAYDHASYAMASEKWAESYALSAAPGLLFDIAQAQRLNGDCAHALSSYRRFIEADPKSEQRPLADEFIRELASTCSASKQMPPAPPSTNHGPTLRVAGFATGSAGIAMLATGIILGRHGQALGADVTRDCATSCDWSAERSKQSAGQHDATVGQILDGVGLAAIVVGVGMYVYGARGEHTTLAIQPTVHGASLTWSGRW